MYRLPAYLTAFFLLVGPACGAEAGSVKTGTENKAGHDIAPVAHTVSTTYVIKTSDKKIGEITSLRKASGEADDYIVAVEVHLTINVDDYWSNYSLRSSETMKLNQVGLYEYHGKYLENGNLIQLDAVLRDKLLAINVKEDGDDQNIHFEDCDYDATSEDVSWRFLRSGKLSSELMVLDFNDFEVKPIKYTNLGTHLVEIANHRFHGHRIHFKGKEKSGEMWLVEDEMGVWLLKETGKDNEGDYVIQLTGYKRESSRNSQ